MITYYFRTIKDAELKQIGGERNGVWVHAEAPTEGEIIQLVEKFGLDLSILEDAQDFFEVPRLERSGGVTYFFTRYPYNDQKEDVDTAPLLIAVGESFVLTLALRPVPQLDKIINGTMIVYTTQKTKLFIQIMESLTQSFERQLIGLRRAMHRDRIELKRFGSQKIVRFVNYEHKINDMVAALVPTNAALQQVMNGHYFQMNYPDAEHTGYRRWTK